MQRSDYPLNPPKIDGTFHQPQDSYKPVNISIDLPDILVFIYGVEVTEDVVSVNYTHQDSGSPSTCTIELNSNMEKWIMTPRNLGFNFVTGSNTMDEPEQNLKYANSDEIAGSLNPTGGALDHKLGIKTTHDKDISNVLAEYKRTGKIPTFLLTDSKNQPLGADGRFRLRPFDDQIKMDDSFYGMFKNPTQNPELYRYSEYKKFLIYSIKINALIAYQDKQEVQTRPETPKVITPNIPNTPPNKITKEVEECTTKTEQKTVTTQVIVGNFKKQGTQLVSTGGAESGASPTLDGTDQANLSLANQKLDKLLTTINNKRNVEKQATFVRSIILSQSTVNGEAVFNYANEYKKTYTEVTLIKTTKTVTVDTDSTSQSTDDCKDPVDGKPPTKDLVPPDKVLNPDPTPPTKMETVNVTNSTDETEVRIAVTSEEQLDPSQVNTYKSDNPLSFTLPVQDQEKILKDTLAKFKFKEIQGQKAALGNTNTTTNSSFDPQNSGIKLLASDTINQSFNTKKPESYKELVTKGKINEGEKGAKESLLTKIRIERVPRNEPTTPTQNPPTNVIKFIPSINCSVQLSITLDTIKTVLGKNTIDTEIEAKQIADYIKCTDCYTAKDANGKLGLYRRATDRFLTQEAQSTNYTNAYQTFQSQQIQDKTRIATIGGGIFTPGTTITLDEKFKPEPIDRTIDAFTFLKSYAQLTLEYHRTLRAMDFFFNSKYSPAGVRITNDPKIELDPVNLTGSQVKSSNNELAINFASDTYPNGASDSVTPGGVHDLKYAYILCTLLRAELTFYLAREKNISTGVIYDPNTPPYYSKQTNLEFQNAITSDSRILDISTNELNKISSSSSPEDTALKKNAHLFANHVRDTNRHKYLGPIDKELQSIQEKIHTICRQQNPDKQPINQVADDINRVLYPEFFKSIAQIKGISVLDFLRQTNFDQEYKPYQTNVELNNSTFNGLLIGAESFFSRKESWDNLLGLTCKRARELTSILTNTPYIKPSILYIKDGTIDKTVNGDSPSTFLFTDGAGNKSIINKAERFKQVYNSALSNSFLSKNERYPNNTGKTETKFPNGALLTDTGQPSGYFFGFFDVFNQKSLDENNNASVVDPRVELLVNSGLGFSEKIFQQLSLPDEKYYLTGGENLTGINSTPTVNSKLVFETWSIYASYKKTYVSESPVQKVVKPATPPTPPPGTTTLTPVIGSDILEFYANLFIKTVDCVDKDFRKFVESYFASLASATIQANLGESNTLFALQNIFFIMRSILYVQYNSVRGNTPISKEIIDSVNKYNALAKFFNEKAQSIIQSSGIQNTGITGAEFIDTNKPPSKPESLTLVPDIRSQADLILALGKQSQYDILVRKLSDCGLTIGLPLPKSTPIKPAPQPDPPKKKEEPAKVDTLPDQSPIADSVLAYQYRFYPGDPIFNTGDPVRVFIRSRTPERYIDSDKNTFDDYVYYHAFTGVIRNIQKSLSPETRKLSITVTDMKTLLQDATLATKPAVVNERNLDVNLFGLTPFQNKFVLGSVRSTIEQIIAARGPTEDYSVPLNSESARLERLIQEANKGNNTTKSAMQKMLAEFKPGDTQKFSQWINSNFNVLAKDVYKLYGVILRAYTPDKGVSSFSSKVNGTPILNSSTITPTFLNFNLLEQITKQNVTPLNVNDLLAVLSDKTKTEIKNPTLDNVLDYFRKKESSFSTEKDTFIVAIVDPKAEPIASFTTKGKQILDKVKSIQLIKNIELDKGESANNTNNLHDQILVDIDQVRYIKKSDKTERFVTLTGETEVQKLYDEAFSKCISKPINRILPYSRTVTGVGDYGVRVITVLGAPKSNLSTKTTKSGELIPDLTQTAKQFQAAWELHDMHPRYRNPQVIRQSWNLLEKLSSIALSEFTKYDRNTTEDQIVRTVRQEFDAIFNGTSFQDQFVINSLVERFFSVVNGITLTPEDKNNISNLIQEPKFVQELAQSIEVPQTANYIKATLIDALIKNEIDSGYFYIVEPQGFVSSSFHPYNPKIDTFSLFDTDIKSRLQIINEMCENIGWYFYTTPKGDFVLQPPMVPFLPHNFSFAYDETGTKRIGAGIYNKQYLLEGRQIENISFTDNSGNESCYNSVECIGEMPLVGAVVEGGKAGPYRAVIMRSDLIAKNGLKPTTIQKEYIMSQQGCAAAAYIYLEQAQRDAKTINLSGFFDPSILLCRPCLIAPDYIAGYIKSISVSWSGGSNINVSIELNNLRSVTTKRHQMDQLILNEFEAITYLTYASYWSNRKAGREIKDLLSGVGTDEFGDKKSQSDSMMQQLILAAENKARTDKSEAFKNLDVANQNILKFQDPKSNATLVKLISEIGRL